MSPADADLQDAYPDDWKALRSARLKIATRFPRSSQLVSDRPRPCCEWCGKPQGAEITNREGGGWTRWREWDDEFAERAQFSPSGELQGRTADTVVTVPEDTTTVVLTIAHLCQDPRCADPEHLRALCQRCHLQYDQQAEQKRRRERIQQEVLGQQTLTEPIDCSDFDATEVRE